MEWWLAAVIFFSAMLFLLFLGINIPFALGFVAVAGILILWNNPAAGFITVVHEAYDRGTNFLILAVPMFVLLAEAIMAGGISKESFDSLSRILCRVPGALAIATTVMASLFAALTGSSLANAAIIGRVSIPEMKRHNYNMGLAGGVVVAGGALGILIPPSIPMIFFAMFSEESVAKLFMAGVVPGIMCASLMIIYIIILSIVNPKMAPALPKVAFLPALKQGYKLYPLVVLILLMFIAFYFGIATPMEIGAVAAFLAFIMVFAYKKFTKAGFMAICRNTTHTTLMLLWILVAALAFGVVLAYVKVPQNLTQFVSGLPLEPLVILIILNIFLLLLGCLLETGAIIMVVWPLLIIVAQAMGWDLYWFAVILVLQMELGQMTPPVGIVLFGMRAIAPEITVREGYGGVMPFVAILVFSIGLIIAFPQIVLWLPSHL